MMLALPWPTYCGHPSASREGVGAGEPERRGKRRRTRGNARQIISISGGTFMCAKRTKTDQNGPKRTMYCQRDNRSFVHRKEAQWTRYPTLLRPSPSASRKCKGGGGRLRAMSTPPIQLPQHHRRHVIGGHQRRCFNSCARAQSQTMWAIWVAPWEAPRGFSQSVKACSLPSTGT